MSVWPNPPRFAGDVSQMAHMVPEWLPPVVAGTRVDIWTAEAILAIARRIEALEANQ